MSVLKAGAALLAGAMMAVGDVMPPIGGRPTPTFQRVVDYDGLGRKKKAPKQPDHNAKRRTKAWRDYAARVVATHSGRPDPRDDEYLHAHARRRRAEQGRAVA